MKSEECKNCDGCPAECCKYVAIEIDTPEDIDDFEDIKWYVSHKNITTQQSLYPSHYPREEEAPTQDTEEPTHQAERLVDDEEPKSIVGPTIMITLGVQLLLLSFFMLLFANDGIMVLRWDARFWFFYMIAAVPLLIFGYRSVDRL